MEGKTKIKQCCISYFKFLSNTWKWFYFYFRDYASNLSGATIEQGGSTIVLPNLCKVLNIDPCEESDVAIGVQVRVSH